VSRPGSRRLADPSQLGVGDVICDSVIFPDMIFPPPASCWEYTELPQFQCHVSISCAPPLLHVLLPLCFTSFLRSFHSGVSVSPHTSFHSSVCTLENHPTEFAICHICSSEDSSQVAVGNYANRVVNQVFLVVSVQ